METLKPIFDMADRFGAAAPVIGLLWWWAWQAHTERRDLTAKLIELTRDQIESEKEMTAALTVLSAKVVR